MLRLPPFRYLAPRGLDEAALMLAQEGVEVTPGTADYVWYTAAMPERDYCAQLRR